MRWSRGPKSMGGFADIGQAYLDLICIKTVLRKTIIERSRETPIMSRIAALLASAALAGVVLAQAPILHAQALPPVPKAADAPTGPMTAEEQRLTLEDLA